VTAKAMNTALYTYSPGNAYTPTGILFHANRPLLVESLGSARTQASSSTGTVTSLNGNNLWRNYFDSSALFGPGADAQFTGGTGQFNPNVPGTAGAAGTPGGLYLVWGFPAFAATTNAGGSGAALLENGTSVGGGQQLSSTVNQNCAYALDLVAATQNQRTALQGYCADASGSGYAYVANTTDYSGNATRFYGAWAGTGNFSTITSVPAPPSWTSTSSVTSALLNGAAIGLPFSLLDNPPALRAGAALSTSIPASANTTVPVNATTVDTANAFNGTTHAYTVPLTGVWLVHGSIHYASGSTGALYAGIGIASAVVWGPAYSSAGSGSTTCQVVKLLDLNAGDAVTLVTNSTGSNSLGSGAQSRLIMTWLGALAGSNGSVAWKPPDTSYRWQAGLSGSALVAAFQSHLTSDISFLLNRPYLLNYQGTAQTGQVSGAFNTVTMNASPAGIVHGSAGDNYGGWNSSSGWYAAQVPGWYLVAGGYKQSSLASSASCRAAIYQSPGGASAPDWYQYVAASATGGVFPGAEAIGLYYLHTGDVVQPQYQQQGGGVTYSTIDNTAHPGHGCTFSLVWICE
jgi:hypothetical protein